jgi:hypothetical protein
MKNPFWEAAAGILLAMIILALMTFYLNNLRMP